MGGTEAEIFYAGAAPNQASGVFQINVRVPETIAPDSTTVSLSIANESAKPISIAVR